MTLPLPYSSFEDEGVEGNFDTIKQMFPLSRKYMKIETPNVVAAAGQPAFQNSWVNYDAATFRGARYWKDPMGIVWVEGLIKSGTIGTTVFEFPAGYRPGVALRFETITNSGIGYFDVAATGNLVAQSGGNTWFAINCSFKQET